MNTTNSPINPFDDILEALLADIAISVQLPPGKHAKAVDRAEALERHIERDGSPMKGMINLFYAQGSMATGTTINARLKNDEFDIDKVAETLFPPGTPPAVVLDTLYIAIRGEPGSRYHNMVERRTRCVTVYYADGMHIDITPMILEAGTQPRTSWLFHAHEKEPHQKHETLKGNPWGFADHFNALMPEAGAFAKAFGQRTMKAEILADADSEHVPDPQPAYSKSLTVVGLQLFKRHRNVIYDDRKGRMPATVMMSCLALDVVGRATSLSEELLYQSVNMLDQLQRAHNRGVLLSVTNPTCEDDDFTDRWPGSMADQGLFIRDLKRFVANIRRLRSGEFSVPEMQAILEEMFGEAPTQAAVQRYNQRMGQHIQQNRIVHRAGGGVSLSAAAVTPSTPGYAKPNTFFGGKMKE